MSLTPSLVLFLSPREHITLPTILQRTRDPRPKSVMELHFPDETLAVRLRLSPALLELQRSFSCFDALLVVFGEGFQVAVSTVLPALTPVGVRKASPSAETSFVDVLEVDEVLFGNE